MDEAVEKYWQRLMSNVTKVASRVLRPSADLTPVYLRGGEPVLSHHLARVPGRRDLLEQTSSGQSRLPADLTAEAKCFSLWEFGATEVRF